VPGSFHVEFVVDSHNGTDLSQSSVLPGNIVPPSLSLFSYIIWELNNRHVGDRCSDIFLHHRHQQQQ
jgi:hypothetical protein